MIDLRHVWLPQIITYAELISTGQLEREWLGQTTPMTSVTDPDELHEQIFEDIDAENVWAEHRHNSGLPTAAVRAVDGFLTALLAIDESDAQRVVASRAWGEAKEAGKALLAIVG